MIDHDVEESRIDRELVRQEDGPDPFSAAVRATRMPMVITDPRQPDNPIVFVNDAFLRQTGYSRDEVLGHNCRFLQGPSTSREDVAKVRTAVAEERSIEIELLNFRKDGTSFWNRLLLSPVRHDGELTYFFASQFDVTRERTRIDSLAENRDTLEDELRARISDLTKTEERLRFTLQAGKLGFWTLDLAEGRLVASSLCKQNFGRSPTDDFTYDDLKAAIVPEHVATWQDRVALALSPPGELSVEYEITTPSGEQRWIEVRGQTSFDADGRPTAMSGVSVDITERRAAEEHRKLLSRELNHRVKNSLSMVQSIFGQTLKHAGSIEEARETVNARIQAMAAAQDVLLEQGWTSSQLSHVVHAALKPFEDGRQRIRHRGPEVRVSAAAATSFSLAFHELATNAVKYGALSTDSGRVEILWEVRDGVLHLTWEEIGGPPVVTPTRRGFGTTIIEKALAASIQGSATLHYRPAGLVMEVVTDVAKLKSDDL